MVDTLLAAVGIVVKEPWADDISYEMLNYTLWKVQNGGDGCGYVALKDNIGVRPDSDQTVWRKAVEAGQSIYDLAVKYGHFDGTEEEFEAQYQAALQAAVDAASAASATNVEIQSAEELRVTAEQNRVSAETSRVSAEESRASAELTRENNELARSNNESGRSVAEQSRATAEENRVSAENSRVSAENNRANAEVDRRNTFEALEEDMETAIGQADAATAAASAINNQIVSAENSRVSAENGRVTAEGNRVTAEQGRADAETSRATAENGRVTAEESRVSAETSRATAETNRETRANTDHNTATSDHETATSDHNTAASDHTQAGTDHERAESDHSRAEEDHASIADKVSQEELALAIEPLARKDGSYDTMSVGLAKNLEGRTNVTDSFFERTTGGDAEVANGLAQMMEVGGNSVKFNQVAGILSAFDSSGYSSAQDGDKYKITNVSAATPTTCNLGEVAHITENIIVGHKYYIRGDYEYYIGLNLYAGDGSTSFNQIYTATTTPTHAYLRIKRAIPLDILPVGGSIYLHIIFTDLTAIFGTDAKIAAALGITTAEITTDAGVAAFEEWLAENVGLRAYYPYTEPTVLNVNMAGIETVGRNLLDPTTGKARILGAYSDVYGNYYGITGTHGAITFTSDMGETSTITPDEDGKFLLEEPGELSVADAGADCCVFLWWDGTQTDYAEHKDEKTYLDVTHIYGKLNGTGDLVRVWPTGMPKIVDLKDTLRIEDGQVVARRIIRGVDMGTLNWFKQTHSTSGNVRFSTTPTGKKAGSYVISEPYVNSNEPVNYGSQTKDKVICGHPDNTSVYAMDYAYSDSDDTTYKAAMSGQMLYFELATPQIYTDLVYQGSSYFADGTPVTLPLNYNADNWGIERALPLNTTEALATAKPELTCKYSIDAVETMNTHADEIEDLYDKNEELDAKKPNKTGDYPDMAVGSAKTLEGTDNKVEDFVFTAPQCADGIAKLNEVRGKSLVWNQVIPNAKTTISVGTYDYGAYVYGLSFVNGHKYILLIDNPELDGGMRVTGTSYSSLRRQKQIILYDGDTGSGNSYMVQIGGTSTKESHIFFADLTLMFGAGNEPSTVEEFEALYPLPYYAYNEGEIISNKTEAVEVVGRNQWDEEWENGTILTTTGQNDQFAEPNKIRSKGYIPVIPGQQYYFKCPVRLNVFFYDASEVFLGFGWWTAENGPLNNTKTIPSGVYKLRFSTQGSTVSTYANNICINLSDPSFNGQYEQYKHNTIELNLPTLTGKLNGEGESVVVFPEGLKSAGSVYDEIVGNKAIKRVGVVDLGTIEWKKTERASLLVPFFEPTVFTLPVGSSNATFAKYPLDSDLYRDDKEDAYDILESWGTLIIRDNTYSTAADFKTAMNGVLLYYELVEPLAYELDEGVPETFQAYKGGTLKQLPENGSEPTTAPCVMSVTYALDAVGILTGLPQNYVSKESLQAMLTAMQSAGLFASYTMTYNSTTGKYEFTFTANS